MQRPFDRGVSQDPSIASNNGPTVELVQTQSALREVLRRNNEPKPLSLVPTMGNLHPGHLKLLDAAVLQEGTSVATIFVNPMQFGPNEDFEKYPRVLEADSKLVAQMGIDVLFAPSLEDMYPHGQLSQTTVNVPKLGDCLCGASRPGHFDGVTTVVSKLFNLVRPDIAFFGEKDWQQLTIIRKMVDDLDFPIQIVGIPTERESDGLAMSSRNQYLTERERQIAPQLFRILQDVAASVRSGVIEFDALEESACAGLLAAGFRPDYVAVRVASSLEPPRTNRGGLRVFGAAHLGKARLIDNVSVDQ